MPKAKTKSNNNHSNKHHSSFDIALDSFIEYGHFILTDEILTIESLIHFKECLKKRSLCPSENPYKFCLNNVRFKLQVPPFALKERIQHELDSILWQLHLIFHFSPKWGAIAFDNVTILHGDNSYPLSLYFMYRLISIITDKKDEEDEENEKDKQEKKLKNYLTELSITKAEFHACCWMRYLTSGPRLNSLTLEWLTNEDQTDNWLVLCEALHCAKIKFLNFGNTEISMEGYQALYELLDKNYFIEKIKLKEPTDPAAFVIFKKINRRLSEGITGKNRFDIERFNQAEFLCLFLQAKNNLAYETDVIKVEQLEREIEFLLEEKYVLFSICHTHRQHLLTLAPAFYAVYLDHAIYIEDRLALFRLDLNQFLVKEKRTLGHFLLEDALKKNDSFMMKCLIKKGEANLLEQQDDEKPFLIKIFEKNKDFKLLILDHIYYDKTLLRMTEQFLKNYPKSEEIMIDMGNFLISYAEILKKRTCPHLLSDFQRLCNLFKDIARLSRPSKQRDKEFIEIYYRLFKSLTLLHNKEGRVTVESISNVQKLLAEVKAISVKSDWGWKYRSQLHCGLRSRLDSLRKNIKEIKQLAEKDDMIAEKDKVIAQQAGALKEMTKKNTYLKNKITKLEEDKTTEKATYAKEKAEYETELQKLKVTLAAMQAQLKMANKESKTSESLNELGPSTSFFSRS